MAIVQRLFRRKWMENRKISSTFIREELKKGNMEKISELLGTDFLWKVRWNTEKVLGIRNFSRQPI